MKKLKYIKLFAQWSSFESVFEGKYPSEFSHQRDTNPNEIKVGLKSPYKSGNYDKLILNK